MAKAISIWVNDNPIQDVRQLNTFSYPRVFENPLLEHFDYLVKNSTEITIDARYNLRPDLLSYEMYGTNFWYPVILMVNKVGSIFQFKAEYLNNKCLIPNRDAVLYALENVGWDEADDAK
jgi:hypothetical protein